MHAHAELALFVYSDQKQQIEIGHDGDGQKAYFNLLRIRQIAFEKGEGLVHELFQTEVAVIRPIVFMDKIIQNLDDVTLVVKGTAGGFHLGTDVADLGVRQISLVIQGFVKDGKVLVFKAHGIILRLYVLLFID